MIESHDRIGQDDRNHRMAARISPAYSLIVTTISLAYSLIVAGHRNIVFSPSESRSRASGARVRSVARASGIGRRQKQPQDRTRGSWSKQERLQDRNDTGSQREQAPGSLWDRFWGVAGSLRGRIAAGSGSRIAAVAGSERWQDRIAPLSARGHVQKHIYRQAFNRSLNGLK